METFAVPRFFCPFALVAGSSITLPDSAARHAVLARRKKVGDAVVLFNGQGGEYPATIALVGASGVVVSVGEKREVERDPPLAVILVQALQSGDKMDWTIQKAVELGVFSIVPVASRRSVGRLSDDRAKKRLDHWRGVVIAACEQCGRNRLPDVLAPQELRHYLETADKTMLSSRWLLSPLETARSLSSLLPPTSPLALLVGPEGGFDPEEIRLAREKQFLPVRLGPRILRTETAGIAAMAALQSRWGDF